MSYFYSASLGGFYDDVISYPKGLPLDALPISNETYFELLQWQEMGGEISSNGGLPVKKSSAQESILNNVINMIVQHRNKLKQGGFVIGDRWFHSDSESLIRYLGLINLGDAIPEGLQWKTMDGTFVPMTKELAQQVFNAAVLHDQEVFFTAENHLLNVMECTDPGAYNYSEGWPLIFDQS